MINIIVKFDRNIYLNVFANIQQAGGRTGIKATRVNNANVGYIAVQRSDRHECIALFGGNDFGRHDRLIRYKRNCIRDLIDRLAERRDRYLRHLLVSSSFSLTVQSVNVAHTQLINCTQTLWNLKRVFSVNSIFFNFKYNRSILIVSLVLTSRGRHLSSMCGGWLLWAELRWLCSSRIVAAPWVQYMQWYLK